MQRSVFSVFRQCKGDYPWIKCFPGYLLNTHLLYVLACSDWHWQILRNKYGNQCLLEGSGTSTSFDNLVLPKTIGLPGELSAPSPPKALVNLLMRNHLHLPFLSNMEIVIMMLVCFILYIPNRKQWLEIVRWVFQDSGSYLLCHVNILIIYYCWWFCCVLLI